MNEISKALSKLSYIGISMIVPIFLCVFVGKFLDKRFDTQPTFIIIFTILGVLSSFRNLYMMVIREYAKDKKSEEEYFKKLKGLDLIEEKKKEDADD